MQRMKQRTKKLLKRLLSPIFRDVVEEYSNALRRDIFGLWQIDKAMQNSPGIEYLDGWALSPTALGFACARIANEVDPVIIEFGGGQSSLIIASLLRAASKGKLYIIEHNPDYVTKLKNLLALHGLEKRAELVHCPLAYQIDTSAISYDLSYLETLNMEANLVIVDGPPSAIDSRTRLYPLQWSLNNLAKDGRILFDDANRTGEAQCLQSINKTYDNIRVELIDDKKGHAIIRME